MDCKVTCCSKLPDILHNAGRKTRRGPQATAEHYAFHANAMKWYDNTKHLTLMARLAELKHKLEATSKKEEEKKRKRKLKKFLKKRKLLAQLNSINKKILVE